MLNSYPRVLFLDDSIESGFPRMDDRILIRVRERDVARLPGQERTPTCGRTQRTAELHGVVLAGHAEPSDGLTAAIDYDTRDDRLADPHGQVVNHHDPHNGPVTAGGEVNAQFHGLRGNEEAARNPLERRCGDAAQPAWALATRSIGWCVEIGVRPREAHRIDERKAQTHTAVRGAVELEELHVEHVVFRHAG